MPEEAPLPTLWVDMGVLGRPHGLNGAIHLQTTIEQGEVISGTKTVRIKGKKYDREYRINKVHTTNDGILLNLEGINNRDDASRLTGSTLSVKREDFPALNQGEFYYSDMEGAPVQDRFGKVIGKVLHFEEYGTDLMFFEWTGQGIVALPMVDEFVLEIRSEPAAIVVETKNLSEFLQN